MALRIVSPLQSEVAVQRLEELLPRLQRNYAACGTIGNDRITIKRIQRLGNSAFRPQFSGIVQSTDSGCAIDGEFGFTPTARSFMLIWFVGIAIWTCLSLLVWINERFSYSWVLPLGGVGMEVFGLAFVCFAKRYYRLDKEWILRTLCDELHGSVIRHSGVATAIDR